MQPAPAAASTDSAAQLSDYSGSKISAQPVILRVFVGAQPAKVQLARFPIARQLSVGIPMSSPQHRQLEAICSSASTALFVLDKGHHCTYLNPAAQAAIGYSLADIAGRPLEQALQLRTDNGTGFTAATQPGADSAVLAHFITGKGQQRSARFNLTQLADDSGQLLLEAHSISDVTPDAPAADDLVGALKRANENLEDVVEERTRHLRNSEGRYRALFDAIDEGFCIIEMVFDQAGCACDYRFIEANRAFERQAGLGNVRGRMVRELAPGHKRHWFEAFGQVAKTGLPARFTSRAPEADHRWLDVYAFRFEEYGRNCVAVLFQDVTERKQADEELHRAHGLIEGITAGTDDLIAAVDEGYNFLYCNHAYRKEFRRLWAKDVAPGTNLIQALSPWPEAQEKAAGLWKRALEGESFSVTATFGPSEEAQRTYDLRFNPIRDDQGHTIGAAHILRDVTDRIAFDRALQESEERYRLISRATNDVIWDWDLTTNKLEWNQAVLAHFGHTPAEMGSHVDAWYGRIHPDDVNRVKNRIQDAIENGPDSWNSEYRFRKKDGSYATFLDRGYIARGEDGKAYRMIGAMLDLTERQRAEKALRDAAEIDGFRVNLTDAIRPHADPVAIQAESARVVGRHLNANRVHYIEVSPDGEYGRINADYHRGVDSIVGRLRLDELGFVLLDNLRHGETVVVSDIDEDDRLSPDERAKTKAAGVKSYIATPLIKDGRMTAVFVVNHAHPFDWSRRELALIEETAERVWAAVERAKAEDALRLSEQRFRLLTDGIPHMVWLTDAQGHFEFLNRQFTAYTGVPYEPFEAYVFVDRFVHPDDVGATLASWETAMLEQRLFHVEHRIRSASGEYRWFAARAEPQVDEHTGEVLRWFGTMTDIHDQKVAEESLRETDRHKDEFLAMLAHELRNPLAAVRNVERLLEPKLAGDPSGERFMGILRRQTATLSELVEELLDVSRITRGLIELKRERVHLEDIVQQALESVQALIEEKQHQVSVSLPRESVPVNGDAVRLEQILVNLITNAAKYTDPPGGIGIDLSIDGDQAQLQVSDTGIGMTPDVIARVFTLFGQAERGLDRAQGGLGIGLTVVQNLVELHGGTIEAHSDGLGTGAVFTVRLPLAQPENEGAVAAQAAGHAPSKTRRVLVVDDSEDVAETLALLLEGSGHRVAIAHDGDSALAKADEFFPEVVLLDIGLPGMDGYELAKIMKQRPSTDSARLAALTGYGQSSDRERAEEAGFHAHFVKPVNFSTLEQFVNSAVPS